MVAKRAPGSMVLPAPPPMVEKSAAIVFDKTSPKKFGVPPPLMVEPDAGGPMALRWKPPTKFGLLTVGSNRSARCPFTCSSSAWRSVVPRKFGPAVVPGLPVTLQNVLEKDRLFTSAATMVPSTMAALVTALDARLAALTDPLPKPPLATWAAIIA